MIFYCWNGNKRIEPIECKQRENRLWRCVVRACFAVYRIHMCKINKIKLVFFTILYLTQQKKCDIIIKLLHESESWGNLGITGTVKRIGRSTGSSWSCSRKVHLTKSLKCGRMNRLTVLDRLSRENGKKTGWTSVHKMFTWQNRQNVIK